mgnify:CR=1 FL=1
MDIKTVDEIITMLKEYRDSGSRMDSERLLKSPLGQPRKQRLVLAVGHSRANDKGAVGFDGTTDEWTYNRSLAHFIELYLDDSIDVTIIDTYKGSSYTEAMANLKLTVDPLKADLVVELHFNAFSNPNANGYEALFWHSSKHGKQAADTFINTFSSLFPDNTNRGAKAIQDLSERGARFLKTLNAPCIILEPFFGTNPKEWKQFGTETYGKQQLGKAIALSINKCFLDWAK